MDRLLVMRGGALGDFVLGLPALRALRDAFPEATLELIAPSAVLPLAASLVDVATPIERSEVAALFGDYQRLPREIDTRYRDLDLVVLWLADADGSVRRSFQRLATRRVLWAPALPPPGRHALDHLLETLRPLGMTAFAAPDSGSVPESDPRGAPEMAAGATGRSPLRPPAPLVQPSTAAHQRAKTLWNSLGLPADRQVVALHPGSGGDWKRWPVERFAQVADRLADAGLAVVAIQGPADSVVVGHLLEAVQGDPPLVAAGLDAEELAAFLALASSYLGNDSGVTHLAAAVGIPTVAVFGPTDPAVWGPRGPRVVVLRGEQRCSPCGRERAAECRDRACLEAVSVERVMASVQDVLAG
ncbi:MAG: glycosyltransferase family 9 protein [Chloroflexota bacterium]